MKSIIVLMALHLISFYNALENKNYPLDTEIKINTLDEVFFKKQRNDLSFLIDNKFMVLVEYRSTLNENMPPATVCSIKEQEKT